MKNRTFTILIIIAISILGFACKDEKPKETGLEKHFSNYLNNTFKKTLANDSTWYVLVNESGCAGCVSRTIQHYYNNPKAIFIFSVSSRNRFFEHIEEESFRAKQWIDSSGKVNRLKYNNGNIGIISVHDGHIDTVYALDATNTDAVLQILH